MMKYLDQIQHRGEKVSFCSWFKSDRVGHGEEGMTIGSESMLQEQKPTDHVSVHTREASGAGS